MPSLRETQRALAAVFTHPRGVRAGLSAAGFDAARRPVTRVVADRPPVPLLTRLAVYSDAYFLRLAECLGDDYRAVKRALGADDFRRLAADYLAGHPSRSPFINDAGRDLPAFLKTHPFARRLPFLPDLAALERAALKALFTDRDATAAPADLGPAARFRLGAAAAVLAARWPVERLWRARSAPDGAAPRRLSSPAPRRLLVCRTADWVDIVPLPPADAALLSRLVRGLPLARALRDLPPDMTPSRIRRLFTAWIRDGVLVPL